MQSAKAATEVKPRMFVSSTFRGRDPPLPKRRASSAPLRKDAGIYRNPASEVSVSASPGKPAERLIPVSAGPPECGKPNVVGKRFRRVGGARMRRKHPPALDGFDERRRGNDYR